MEETRVIGRTDRHRLRPALVVGVMVLTALSVLGLSAQAQEASPQAQEASPQAQEASPQAQEASPPAQEASPPAQEAAASETPDAGAVDAGSAAPNLLFSSGFEGDVYIDDTLVTDYEDYRFIRGTDAETGFSWPIDILGAVNSALHYIGDDREQAVGAELQTVVGHDGTMTTALYQYEEYEFRGYTQCPYEILDIADGTRDLYIRYWIKLDAESVTQADQWRTFFEWKSVGYAKGDGFRLISFIYTDADGVPYRHFQGDRNPRHPLWEIDDRSLPVPADEWFLTEFYWHWSEGADGRVLWRVNGQVVGEHFGPTTRHSQPIDFIMLSQIYGDANPKHQWVDDIEIRDTLPAD